MIKQIDDLDSQKEWVDWISKYGDDISKQFKKPTTTLLEGIISKIIVSPVMGQTRKVKDTQRGHFLISNSNYQLSMMVLNIRTTRKSQMVILLKMERSQLTQRN